MDKIEVIRHSTIQHGPHSNRVYLMHVSPDDLPDLVDELILLARKKGYTKIFAKVPASYRSHFVTRGFACEASVPQFFQARETALFLGKFLSRGRSVEGARTQIDQILETVRDKQAAETDRGLPPGVTLRRARPGDIESMSRLYGQVFATYPFPIHDPQYLAETMTEQVAYFGAWQGDRLVGLSSGEMDVPDQHVEMTDFAVSPEARGLGLSQALLRVMETQMARQGMATAYSIARALSPGMNATFARAGYHFAGTLKNNTDICGRIESMNVWYKRLPQR